MTLRDLVDLSVGNLWRKKLRSFLTVSGVVIAIATLVAMLSFAAGNQRFVTRGYEQLGLLSRMNVYPQLRGSAADSTGARLNRDAVEKLARIPGVKMAYPYVTFDVTAELADTQVTTTARALPVGAVANEMFATLLGGAAFTSDDAREAIVTEEFLEAVGAGAADSLIGREIIVSMQVASLDSAMAAVVGRPELDVRRLMRTVKIDSLVHRDYQRRLLQSELSARAQRFFEGLMNRQVTVADTLVVTAVAPELEEYPTRLSPIIIPERTARRLSAGGIRLAGDPADLLEAVQTGDLFRQGSEGSTETYSRVSLDLEARASAAAVGDSVEALGFRSFSFAEQFEEIQRFFVYYYLGLGVLGVIALITASLGIVNTMVMSITERRREIGILKSLGADEREIRLTFLTESAAIGAVGSAFGIAVGWVGTRVVSFAMKIYMERQDMPVFEPFALPPWLILLALAFGVLVSLVAGTYPAGRAARVDPVEALRGE